MNTRNITPGDLVLVEDRRGDTYLALVEYREGRAFNVLPLDSRHPQAITARRIIGHFKRRQGEVRDVRRLVARFRRRHGVDTVTVTREVTKPWPVPTPA